MPTEAEIEAAARAMFEVAHPLSASRWDECTNARRDDYIELARAALEAAAIVRGKE